MVRAGGLRERKRRDTLDAIQRNALDLCLRDGYDAVTVDVICEAAGISQRTFFNYVGSKENAVLGAAPPVPTDAQRAAYIAGLGGTVLEDLVHTIGAAFGSAGPGAAELVRKRFAVIEQNPALRRASAAHLEHIRDTLTGLVLQRLAAGRPGSITGDREASGADTRAETAEMSVSVALMVFRHLGHRWAHAAPADPDGPVAAIDRALRLVEAVTARDLR